MNHGIHRICGMVLLALVALGTSLAVAADLAITVSARQRYPWNGLVDLNFTITGTSGTKYDTSFTAKDMVGNTNITIATIRKSDGSAANVTKEQLLPGTYKWVWDAAADLPDGFECDRVTVSGTAGISPFPYSVKFNANGGSGTMANESFTYGTAKALTANAFTRTGYTFQGWATSASGTKIYNDKQSVSNLTETSGAVVNLYAVWDHGKVQLWASGPYWATMNIGATKPEEYGYYFWWGDTVGYKREANKWVARNGSSSNYSFARSNTPTSGKSNSVLQSGGWITTGNVLTLQHDAAKMVWGGNWRLPTNKELNDLCNKCDWTWTSKNGVNGYVIRGRGAYASDSIFLPSAGCGYGTSCNEAGLKGYYWSSAPDSSDSTGDCAKAIYFYQSVYTTDQYCSRFGGFSIRPVQ